MCGFVSIFNIQEQTPELRQQALRMSQKIRHRGPDWSGIYCGGSAILAHERLSIVGRQWIFSLKPCQGMDKTWEMGGCLFEFLIAADGKA